MNPAQTAQLLAWFETHKGVMKAHVMGEEIQYEDFDDGWKVTKHPVWEPTCAYRVKPKPVELELWVCIQDYPGWKKNMMRFVPPPQENLAFWKFMKVREIIEGE